MRFSPSVSIIINTDARAESLKRTLDSLAYLDYARFEVCVVYGPTPDGTKDFLESRKAEIKIAHCPTRNLSMSRNIGIAMAAGEIVAFLDDDSIPEPEWLSKITPAFEQQDVGACGGFLHDNTGIGYQWRFGTVDRLGNADESWQRPPTEFNFPFTANFPHVMANSAFRKSAVLAIRGFDEQYEYYLDETDLICRLVDNGWRIVPIAGAAVHHKFLPSHIRSQGIVKAWSQLVKSKVYFSLVNSQGHNDVPRVVKGALDFIEKFKANLEWGISEGRATEADRSRFSPDVGSGLRDGLAAGLANARKFASEGQLRNFAQPYHQFPIIAPMGKRKTFCLLTKTYPPAPIGGIGRHIHELARGMARLGHQIHVLTRSAEHDSVDFEDGVWVHRIAPKPQGAVKTVRGISVPQHIWDYSATMLTEVQRIGQSRQVEAVIAPIWDCEGIAFLAGREFKLVTGLYTTFRQWLKSNSHRASDPSFLESFLRPMMALEELLFKESDGILADSQAIVAEIETSYGLRFEKARLGLVPLGLEDWSTQPLAEPEPLPEGALRVLFVGRLEERKGIDVLLEAAKAILSSHPQVHLDIVGDDSLVGPHNLTYRAQFELDAGADLTRDRVRFYGEVSEQALRGFYRACDIFVAPSRFESFGLILLEAMMFAKPVVACRAGGMAEIIEHGIGGLLAEPGDVATLTEWLLKLLADPQLRAQLGQAARRRYLSCFTADGMARATLEFTSSLPQKTVGGAAVKERATPTDEGVTVERQTIAGSQSRTKRRIALVNSILARNDAVSAAVVDMYHMLSSDPSLDVSVFAARNDFAELPCHLVGDSAQLLLHSDYLSADLIVWHFGICYEFFNALLVGNGHARQVVVFHNITPKEHMPEKMWSVIDHSLQQRHNMRQADEVWSVSKINAHDARVIGVEDQRMRVIPLCVDAPPLSSLSDKEITPLELLFVGRFIKSKGVLDLLEAVACLRHTELRPFRLALAGNIEFSDPEYVEAVKRKIAERNLTPAVQLVGTVEGPSWAQLYRRAHILAIPSYHEGFCKPVIEGLRAGCIPVGYDSSNLPEVTAGLGRMVPVGDVNALARALTELLTALPNALAHAEEKSLMLDGGRLSVVEFNQASRAYVQRFIPELVGKQFRARVEALLGKYNAASGPQKLEFCAV